MNIANNYTNLSLYRGSRAEDYWKRKGFEPYYQEMRPNLKLPSQFEKLEPNEILAKFNIKSVGFGNWVTLEDKDNYLHVLIVSLYDLNKVLKFNFNIGLGLLSITFGARGVGGALAHFEPKTNIINITRYKRWSSVDKETRFLFTGGLGSLAHEYGHFLDYFIGGYIELDPINRAISGGRKITTKNLEVSINQKIRILSNKILEKIIWKSYNNKFSNYYTRLLRLSKGNIKGYWFRRNELFARAFEVYVNIKLIENGIKNKFLSKQKYDKSRYLTLYEGKIIEPYFDEIFSILRKKIK